MKIHTRKIRKKRGIVHDFFVDEKNEGEMHKKNYILKEMLCNTYKKMRREY